MCICLSCIFIFTICVLGGESIKEINRRSGAQVEIDKAYRNTDGPDKYFFVRGSYDQIMYAQQLIYEKLSGVCVEF